MSTEPDGRQAEDTRTSRERVLAAAAKILSEEGMAARLSVRKVAERAHVSVGSLRHHFPTQQDLRDEVVRQIYDWMATDADIHDASVPARDRLVGCLRSVMSAAEVGQSAREAIMALTETFIAVKPSETVRDAYLVMQDEGQRRVEGWLRTLSDQGHQVHDDIPASARFLNTVLEGLTLQRALPAEDSVAERENQVLYMAADAVLSRSTDA